MQKNKEGFTLVEILMSILIISLVLISGFQTLSAVGIGKVKIIEKTQIEKQAYFASEKLFEIIKKGGTLDYEEYFNRYSYNTQYASGSFLNPSGFGNFGVYGNPGSTVYGSGSYYCASSLGVNMGTSGCLGANNSVGINMITDRQPQRYGQYAEHFIDRNSDLDANADEDGDTNPKDDNDDLSLGEGPNALLVNDVSELYLINALGNERTYFRWKVQHDPNAPNIDCSGTQNMVGDSCLGTIEFLKLRGFDDGNNHNPGVNDNDGSQNDGVIDTWRIHPDFTADSSMPVAGSTSDEYWQAIFPDTIHVSNFLVRAYPLSDVNNAWKSSDISLQVSPYIHLQMTLQPSWGVKKKIKGSFPTSQINTTIQLSDLEIK